MGLHRNEKCIFIMDPLLLKEDKDKAVHVHICIAYMNQRLHNVSK